MNPARRKTTKLMIWTVLSISIGMSQPKWSFHIGSGFYNPSLGYLDPDSNYVIPSLSAFSENILIDWGVKYQFYPNARVGYARSNSYHTGKIGDSDYLRTISYRMLTFETFYYPQENLEINFLLGPMYNKGIIKLTAKSTSTDWDTVLNSYGNSGATLTTGGEMSKRWFGLASMIGFRFYMTPQFAVEGKAGYIRNTYSEKNWKLEKEKVAGPTMNIEKLPVFNIHFVFGW